MIDKDVEDSGDELIGTVPIPTTKQQGLFGSSGIQLTEDELASTVTIKFLRHLNSSQENEIQKLRSFEGQYYDKRQECEVLIKEKEGVEKELAAKKTSENLQKVMISAGGIMLGALKLFEKAPLHVVLLMAIISTLLIIGGMFPVLRIGASK